MLFTNEKYLIKHYTYSIKSWQLYNNNNTGMAMDVVGKRDK